MKRVSFLAAVLALAGVVADTPTVTSVTAQQRYPRNGLVDITLTFSGASNDVAQARCIFTATNCATHTALAVAHVTSTGTVTGVGTTWTRLYVWDATADVGEVKIDDVELNVEAEMPLGGVQLWENGPYWAECNVGASKPEEYGYYFWWGDTVGYTREGGTWTSYYYSGVTWISSMGTRMSSSPFSSSTCPTCGVLLVLETVFGRLISCVAPPFQFGLLHPRLYHRSRHRAVCASSPRMFPVRSCCRT